MMSTNPNTKEPEPFEMPAPPAPSIVPKCDKGGQPAPVHGLRLGMEFRANGVKYRVYKTLARGRLVLKPVK